MNRAALRVASWIVPRARRAEWLAEWRAELAFIAQSDPAGARRFCLGAFPDAVCVRRHNRVERAPFLASPVHCLTALAALAIAGAICRPASIPLAEVVLVRSHGRPAMLTYEQYRRIAARLPAGFEAVAFYREGRQGIRATRSLDAVLRGAALPGVGRAYTTVDDPGPGVGHVVARIDRRAFHRHISVPAPKGGWEIFDCFPLGPGQRAIAILFMFGVAVIVLPTFTSFSLGGSIRGWRARSFFAAKLALALLAVWFSAEALAGVGGPGMLPSGLLVGFLIAIRWALDDQRRRCPECLRRVTNPVSFGCLSHTLLDWHGAEFVCPEGHGMLQVSATPASPYAPLHWVRL